MSSRFFRSRRRSPDDQFSQAWLREFVSRPAFLAKYPYYASLLCRLDPVADPYVRVMGVSVHGMRFYLHVNVDFFTAQPQYLVGVLLHEIHHVVLGHLSHPKFQDLAHADLAELAMEMSANEHIREPLPGQPVVWTDFRDYGIRSGQSSMERYELLVGARLAGRYLSGVSPLDDHLRPGVGSIRVRVQHLARRGLLVAAVRLLREKALPSREPLGSENSSDRRSGDARDLGDGHSGPLLMSQVHDSLPVTSSNPTRRSPRTTRAIPQPSSPFHLPADQPLADRRKADPESPPSPTAAPTRFEDSPRQ